MLLLNTGGPCKAQRNKGQPLGRGQAPLSSPSEKYLLEPLDKAPSFSKLTSVKAYLAYSLQEQGLIIRPRYNVGIKSRRSGNWTTPRLR